MGHSKPYEVGVGGRVQTPFIPKFLKGWKENLTWLPENIEKWGHQSPSPNGSDKYHNV